VRLAVSAVFRCKRERQKTWRRVVSDSTFRWLVNMHSLPRLAYLLGSSQDLYTTWAKQNKLKPSIEDIGENAKLFWIFNEKWGGKIPSRVILYLHGGGFILPIFKDSAPFLHHVQKELEDSGLDVGVAILDYSKRNHINEILPELNVSQLSFLRPLFLCSSFKPLPQSSASFHAESSLPTSS
jgi:hypothetical protein